MCQITYSTIVWCPTNFLWDDVLQHDKILVLVVLTHELNTYSIEQIFTKHLDMSAGNLGAIDIAMKQNKIKTDKYSYWCL